MRIAVALLILITPSLALAEDVTAARKHFERGTALYDLQRYSDAAAEYEAAFDAKNDPAFLFNIGQAYRFAKDYEKSIRSFKAFLRRNPETPMRAQIETWIADMQKSLDTQARNDTHPPQAQAQAQAPTASPTAPTATVASTPPVAADESGRRSGRIKTIAGFATAGVGLAALGTGIAFAFIARGPYNELNAPSNGYVYNPSTQDALHRDQALEISLITVGSVLVVGGVAVGVWGLKQEHGGVHAARATMLAGVVR